MNKYARLYKILEVLMWSNFKTKCVKVVFFSIIQDFASTDEDALMISPLGFWLFGCTFAMA